MSCHLWLLVSLCSISSNSCHELNQFIPIRFSIFLRLHKHTNYFKYIRDIVLRNKATALILTIILRYE